ncbi:hypothetical protein ACERK3_14785 [Phycisphaerales bacterium AB-hyl4]|uniref:Uncharacterized protein n=1 Tax=Natronomicrosphaera hydrolytica TaxID=3242702 RepID=A0ABV4U975_9BACT
MKASPPLYLELTDRVREAIDAARGGAPAALASKGAMRDVIPGLSDVDYRLVLSTDAPEIWRRVGAAFAEAMLAFANAHPDGWRLIEHMPAIGCSSDALDARPVCWERLTWEPLWASSADLLVTPTSPTNDGLAGWWAGKLAGYQPPYDARRDPPINVASAELPRFPAFSLIWHFYAPAVLAATQLLGQSQVRTKWDALRWRAEQGIEPAQQALAIAEADFVNPTSATLARACEADVHQLAQLATDDARPWDALKVMADGLTLSLRDRRLWALATARTYVHRWWFYAHAPQGFDVVAVLRIDRGHVGRFTLGPVRDSREAMEAMRGHAQDGARFDAAIEALMAEHRNTDTSRPRDTFLAMREQYLVVLEALERWHAAA